MDFFFACLVAVAVAACCGLRAFVPLLAVSVFAGVGWVDLQPAWTSLGSVPITVLLGGFAAAEILVDKVGSAQRWSGVLSFVLRPMAGTLVVLALVPVDPLTAAALGSVIAAGLGVGVARLRHTVTQSSEGPLGGVALSMFEDALVGIATGLAWVAPPLALLGLAVYGLGSVWVTGSWQRRRWAKLAASPALRAVPTAA